MVAWLIKQWNASCSILLCCWISCNNYDIITALLQHIIIVMHTWFTPTRTALFNQALNFFLSLLHLLSQALFALISLWQLVYYICIYTVYTRGQLTNDQTCSYDPETWPTSSVSIYFYYDAVGRLTVQYIMAFMFFIFKACYVIFPPVIQKL